MHSGKGCVVWLTGISGAGKTTIASALGSLLRDKGVPSLPIDGDVLRGGLSRDLGFSAEDRMESMRRAAEVAKLASNHGFVAITALISPSEAGRKLVRECMGHDRFALVHIDTPIEVAEVRDVKGLYKRARAGQIPNFTGIDSAYEAPTVCELVIQTASQPPMVAAEQILAYVEQRGWLG